MQIQNSKFIFPDDVNQTRKKLIQLAHQERGERKAIGA
jgi:hypothetical protein